MTDHAADIIPLYERNTKYWDSDRGRRLIEKAWLDRFMGLQPGERHVLDLGCGSAEPIARYLVEDGCDVTGIDAAPSMIDMCRQRFPEQTWLVADMRKLSLNRIFSGIVAWNSFFHLPPDDQREMFSIFRSHATQGSALMFTSGTTHGVSVGEYRGAPLYHASLDSAEYRELLITHGFDVVTHVVEDPDCGGHTIWLARYLGE